MAPLINKQKDEIDSLLNQIDTKVYQKCGLEILDFTPELESKEYAASRYKINDLHIASRNAKITPKKIGQFVTFWKRKGKGQIEPFNEKDQIECFVVNVRTENELGQFVFPKSALIKKGIISTTKKEGKRAFRVYPKWDIPKNKQSAQTQKWQLDYFYQIDDSVDFNMVTELYKNK